MAKAVKIQRSIMLDEEIICGVQDIADEQNRSFSSMLNILLNNELKKRKKK